MSTDTYAHLSAREAVMMGDAPDLPITAELMRLQGENRMLRELVQDMHECMKSDCDVCRRKNKRHEWGACELYVKEGGFINRIRALGIEVSS